jgi:hypothetical protein
MNSNRFVGCCGAYCRTCKPYVDGLCKGCKIGFDTGERDIDRAKCKIKLCCFRDRELDTCADCPSLGSCETIGSWYAKKGYKYRKYKHSIDFIRENGYPRFIQRADKWKGAYGKLE